MPDKVGENRTSIAPHNEVRKFYTWNRSLKQVTNRIDVLVRIRLIVPGNNFNYLWWL
jgi:hypothetical protein